MKKLLLLISTAFFVISCVQTSADNSREGVGLKIEENRDSLTLSNAGFAVDFINDYIDNIHKYENYQDIIDWVNANELVTQEFKNEFSRILEKGYEEDPLVGLGFDPIFDAQDYPSNGFEIETIDPISKLVYLKGNEWEDFKLNMRAKQVDVKWLVDGCGVVNMPEDDRAER